MSNQNNNNNKPSQQHKEPKGENDTNKQDSNYPTNNNNNEKKDTNKVKQKNKQKQKDNYNQSKEQPSSDMIDRKDGKPESKEDKPKYIDLQITPRAIDLMVYSLKKAYLFNSSIIVLPDSQKAIGYMKMSKPLVALLEKAKIELKEDNINAIKNFLDEQNTHIDKLVQSLDGEKLNMDDFFDIPDTKQDKGGNANKATK